MAKPSKDRKMLNLGNTQLWYDQYRDCLQISITDSDLKQPVKISVPTGRAAEDSLRALLDKHRLPTGFRRNESLDDSTMDAWRQAMVAALPGRLTAHLITSHVMELSTTDRVAVTTWVYDTGSSTDWLEYARFLDDIATELRKRDHSLAALSLVPMGEFDDSGNEVHGKPGATGFRIWEVTKLPRWNALNEMAQDAYMHLVLVPAVRQVLGHPHVHLSYPGRISKHDSPTHLIEARLRGDVGALVEEPLLRRQLAELLGVKSVIAARQHDDLFSASTGDFTVVFGDGRDRAMRYVNPTVLANQFLNKVEHGVDYEPPRSGL